MTASTPTASARAASDASTMSPDEARRAAAAADARAAEATAVADRAKLISRKARAAAAKASSEATKFRAKAIVGGPHRDKPTAAEAKARLLDAARRIHPLQDARAAAGEHPFVTVGIAAGAGAVLGASGGLLGNVVGGGARLAATLLSIARPALLAAGKFAAAQALAKQAAAKAETDHVAADAPIPVGDPTSL